MHYTAISVIFSNIHEQTLAFDFISILEPQIDRSWCKSTIILQRSPDKWKRFQKHWGNETVVTWIKLIFNSSPGSVFQQKTEQKSHRGGSLHVQNGSNISSKLCSKLVLSFLLGDNTNKFTDPWKQREIKCLIMKD